MTEVCDACGAPTVNQEGACPHCGEQGIKIPRTTSTAFPAAQMQGRLPENLAAVLAYFTVIPAIVFLLTKPYRKNEFVRFHAFQCLGLFAATLAVAFLFLLLANIAAINLLLIPLSIITAIGIALLVLVCMLKAYQHQNYAVPILGALARKQSLRS